MAFVKVAKLSALPAGSATEVRVGERYIALCNVEGRVTAIDGVCLHRGGPLGQGPIQHGKVVCPWHCWEFDCATGEYDYDPALRQEVFAVRIEGDDVLVEV